MTAPREERQDESLDAIRRDEESVARSAELFYGNVHEFVTERFAYFFPRPAPGSGQVWCPQWFAHVPALSRLDAVWRAWEMLRFDGALGMSNWWLHHADPHMRVLMDPVTGPFAHCVDGHRSGEPLPLDTPPEGLFKDQRETPRDPFAFD
ncbi:MULTISPECIES: DUF4913 domain-containing protein [unclassified Streptomyces]|uniref:DUF4913 domain-containing protein n=1 Tax=unclassified Streptomyces TaxID=2593676 RepID=UPI002E7766E3|nr:DUF4913 domain-containing protein [Streptomyces sp. JV176]MEE1802124.1 DUF4913 domain-containing protein [Streptomyces sp. JV176]